MSCGYEDVCVFYMFSHKCQDCERLDDDRVDWLEFDSKIIKEAKEKAIGSNKKLCEVCNDKEKCKQCLIVGEFVRKEKANGRSFEVKE